VSKEGHPGLQRATAAEKVYIKFAGIFQFRKERNDPSAVDRRSRKGVYKIHAAWLRSGEATEEGREEQMENSAGQERRL